MPTIDLITLSDYATSECDISDLPSIFREKIKIHLIDEDMVHLCVVTRHLDRFQFQIVTSKRVVLVHGELHKKEIKPSSGGGLGTKDRSLLLRDFTGLRHYEENMINTTNEYYLEVCGTTREIQFRFANKESLTKFAGLLLNVANNARKNV